LPQLKKSLIHNLKLFLGNTEMASSSAFIVNALQHYIRMHFFFAWLCVQQQAKQPCLISSMLWNDWSIDMIHYHTTKRGEHRQYKRMWIKPNLSQSHGRNETKTGQWSPH